VNQGFRLRCSTSISSSINTFLWLPKCQSWKISPGWSVKTLELINPRIPQPQLIIYG